MHDIKNSKSFPQLARSIFVAFVVELDASGDVDVAAAVPIVVCSAFTVCCNWKQTHRNWKCYYYFSFFCFANGASCVCAVGVCAHATRISKLIEIEKLCLPCRVDRWLLQLRSVVPWPLLSLPPPSLFYCHRQRMQDYCNPLYWLSFMQHNHKENEKWVKLIWQLPDCTQFYYNIRNSICRFLSRIKCQWAHISRSFHCIGGSQCAN